MSEIHNKSMPIKTLKGGVNFYINGEMQKSVGFWVS